LAVATDDVFLGTTFGNPAAAEPFAVEPQRAVGFLV
jgi:hypothetical protein